MASMPPGRFSVGATGVAPTAAMCRGARVPHSHPDGHLSDSREGDTPARLYTRGCIYVACEKKQ